MKKSVIMVFAAAAVLASCSNEEVTPAIDGKDVLITLNSTTIEASGLSTRAPFEGAIGASNQLVARVIASEATGFSTVYVDGTMTFAGSAASYDLGSTGTTATTTYPASAPVYLFGLYPDDAWSYATGVAECTFTGKEDVMATSQISTVATDVTSFSYKTLEFKHLLTKLEVKMNATSAAIAAFGNITSIKLIDDNDAATTDVNNIVKVNNTAAAMVPTFSSDAATATALDFYGLSADATGAKTYTASAVSNYALTTASELVAYSMVAPVTAAAGATEYTLEIVTANAGPKIIAIDLNKAGSTASTATAFTGSTAGYSFGISISFISVNEITANVSVENWKEEGEFEGKITN